MNIETKTQHFIITNIVANSCLGFTHFAELSPVEKGHLGICRNGFLFEQCKRLFERIFCHSFPCAKRTTEKAWVRITGRNNLLV